MILFGRLIGYLVKRSMSGMPKSSVEVSDVDLTELDELTEKLGETEDARDRAYNLLDGIVRVLEETLVCQSDEQVGEVCLSVAEELTGSKFGFIGLINQEGTFDDIAISDPGWKECEMPQSEATKLIKGMPLTGLDRGTMLEGVSRIVNDPGSHPDAKGTPDGHPEITRFLGVCLTYKGKVIGMIGLGNKEDDYVLADQEVIEKLSAAFTEVLMRDRISGSSAVPETENSKLKTQNSLIQNA